MGLVKNAHISGWVYVLRSVASDLLHESLSAGPYSNDSLRLSTRQRRDVIYSVTALASSSSPTSDVVIISLLGDNLINFHPFCQIYGHCKEDDGDVINPFLGWLVVVVHILHPSPSCCCCCAIKRSSTHSHRTTTHTFHIMLYSSGGGLRMGE